MPSSTKKTVPPLTLAEIIGRDLLAVWLAAKHGRGIYLSERTGIDVASISRMKSGLMRITLEAAIRIEIGTSRTLRAEILCPSMAYMIKRFRNKKDAKV